MPQFYPAWGTEVEPDAANISLWMENLYGKTEQINQARWNQANIDTLFYAGEQGFINQFFNFSPRNNAQSYYFNLIQQPVNMVTGYQRQHRKSITYLPVEGAHQQSADDMTTVETYANNYRHRLEKFSKGCELSAISNMCLIQPYLDYTDDPINGTLDLAVWPYNSFVVDPYFREPDMSDANYIWCQKYISKAMAKRYFPNASQEIDYMPVMGTLKGKFYFLPENYNLARNDLLTLSYIWYKSSRKRKMLYNQNDGIAYDYVDNGFLNEMLQKTGFFQVIEIEVPTWKVCIVLNEKLMYQGFNPLGFDECPMIPLFWNYDPHMAQYSLRYRSLVTSMRSSQFLLNRRIILNHDISESSINTGFLRLENAIANEEVLSGQGQGKDIIVKDQGRAIQEVIQKITPNAVPPSDMDLANQMADFIYKTSGVNEELMGMASDTDTGIEVMLKQGAGLITLQKYFDQWDEALKLLGKLDFQIMKNNWSPAKFARILGREPSAEILNGTFSKYDVQVAEGLNTAVQQQMQYAQMKQLNEIYPIPPKLFVKYATIQGKDEIIKAIEEQQQQQQAMQQQQMLLEQARIESELQLIQAKAMSEVGLARERQGRAESNIGLFEERLSEITQNRSMALKNKMEALEKLMVIIKSYGELESALAMQELEKQESVNIQKEDVEKLDAKATAASNDFLKNNMQNIQSPYNMKPNEQTTEALL